MILLLATPAEAHCYHIWHYPKPQRCFTALAPKRIANLGQRVSASHQDVSASTHENPPSPTETQERIEIPIPDLSADWGGGPVDERLLGIAKLRALSNGP